MNLVIASAVLGVAVVNLAQAAEPGAQVRRTGPPSIRGGHTGDAQVSRARESGGTVAVVYAPRDRSAAQSQHPFSRPFSKGPPSWK